MYGAAIIAAGPRWTDELIDLAPGAHVVILTEEDPDAVGIEGREAGLHLRDTLAILWPQTIRFALLFRIPTEAVLATLRKDGTGVLNIAGCRIRWKSEAERLAALPGSMPKANESVGTFQTRDRSAERPEDSQNPLGRWPANVAFVHGAHCTLAGTARIEGHKGYPNGPGGSSVQFSQKGTKTTRTGAWAGHADADGKEEVPVWACQPGCPVALLDAKSGLLKSGRLDRATIVAANKTYGVAPKQRVGVYEADAGGASRFYPQFEDPDALLDWIRKLVTPPGAAVLERGV